MLREEVNCDLIGIVLISTYMYVKSVQIKILINKFKGP